MLSEYPSVSGLKDYARAVFGTLKEKDIKIDLDKLIITKSRDYRSTLHKMGYDITDEGKV